MDEPYTTPFPPPPPRRWLTRACWVIAACALGVSLLWPMSGASYLLDLIANLGAQVLLVMVLGLLAVAAARRWRAAIVLGVACMIQATPLVMHRAAWLPCAPGRMTPAGAVRFLHYNDSSLSPGRDVYALMEGSGADVLSMLCPPVSMQAEVIYAKGLEDKYPGKLIREWKVAPDGVNTEISAAFLVARWPVTRVDCAFVGPMADRFIAGIVERPEGRFAVVAVHPRSPRNPARWHEGNFVTEALVALSRKLQGDGLPLVVLADMNSSPTGWRSREACGAGGLRRAKPLLDIEGTYPDVVPLNIRTKTSTSIPAIWPASIAIDDALVSPGVKVEGWGTLPRLQSEHVPVVIELRIPPPGPSAANSGGR